MSATDCLSACRGWLLLSVARCSPRANASASRSCLFSASRCLIRVAATSRRRSSESLDARCRLGIAVVVVEGGCRCRSRWTSARRSPWLYSHERETWASRATVSNVIGAPAFSMRRSAVTARLRVEAARRRAAAITRWELSGRDIGVVLLLVGLDFADHALQVGEDLLVHLQHA